MTNKTLYTKAEVRELENSEIEIEAEVSADVINTYREKALKKIGANMNIDGFRKGHIPEKVIVERITEQGILEEAVEIALKDVYPEIIKDNSLSVIGYPQVSITKLVKDNPFEFKIKTAVLPEVILPEYKKIAEKLVSKKEKVSVSKSEVDDVIMDIRKTRAQALQKGAQIDNGEKTKPKEIKETDLPPLDAEFVKTLGDFKDIADFKKKIEENLVKEKEIRAKEKLRVEIGEAIIKDSKISVPNVLIEAELDKMNSQFKDDVARMGVEFEDYLKKIEKTEEGLRKEWNESAEKRAKMQLIVNKISSDEKIIPDEAEISTQVEHLKQHYKDADPERIKIYVETILTNEKVFEFLENQGVIKNK